ncbi:TIGR04452 family lipoprotein [Leptospira wolffii]|nr:TIGR04452 family lipoprotein [Leptospira wolffii]
MKKLCAIKLLYLLSMLSNCIVADGLGVTGAYKGDEVKRKLVQAGKVGDYLMADRYFSSQGYSGSDLAAKTLMDVAMSSMINDTVMHVDSNRYYSKRAVENCVKVLEVYGVNFDYDSFYTYLSNVSCRLQPHNEFAQSYY